MKKITMKDISNPELVKPFNELGITDKKEIEKTLTLMLEVWRCKYPTKSDTLKHIYKSKLNEKQKIIASYLLGEFYNQ